MSLDEAWEAHREELQSEPPGAERSAILRTWHEVIDARAHDYSDLVASHPRRDEIARLHGSAIIRAYLCGYMARRGWVDEIEALQAPLFLGRELRDELRGMGIELEQVDLGVGVAMNQAMESIVQIGIHGAVEPDAPDAPASAGQH